MEKQKTLYLHCAVIDRSVGLYEAKKMSRRVFQSKTKSYVLLDKYFKFKNINKNMFDPLTFKKQMVDDKLTLIYGELKKQYLDLLEDEPQPREREEGVEEPTVINDISGNVQHDRRDLSGGLQ